MTTLNIKRKVTGIIKMNKKALAISIAASITIAIVFALFIAALIYYPIISMYIIFTILFSIAFIAITYGIYLFITSEFDIL